MITETIEWYTPAEKLPDDTRDVFVKVRAFHTMYFISKAYYSDGSWIVPEVEYNVNEVLFWCDEPKGPANTLE